jgi:MFS family permease
MSIASRAPLWRNADYMLLWSGQLVSVMGSGVSQIAIPLLILALTGSPANAGLAGFLTSLPYLILSLPAGALVDRWDRKWVMICCDAGRALNTASIPIAGAHGHLSVVQLYVNGAIEGTFFVFFNVAEVAALPRVVPKEQLPSASAQNEAGQIIAGLVAPPLGGFIYQSISRTAPFVVDALSYAASVVSLRLIRTRFQEERTVGERHLRAEIAEGLRWLWRQPLIRFMAFLTGGLNFGNAATGLILIVVARAQHAPPAAIGLIFSIGSIGGLIGAMLAPRIQARYGFGPVIISTVWIGAALYPLFALAPNPVVLGIISGGLYLTGPIYNAVQFSYRLSLIPDALQGRVNSAFRLLAFGFQPLGVAAAGVLLQAFGATTTILVYAAVNLALSLLATINPHVRHARPLAVAQAG